MIDFQIVKDKIIQNKITRDIIKKEIKNKKTTIRKLKTELKESVSALNILQIVAKETQDNLVYKISELSTLALDSVFEDKYKFKIDFVEKNNRTSASIYLEDAENNKINPMTASGGGVIDILTFALRLTIHSIQTKSSRKIMILDEPFKWLSVNLQSKASQLLKELSDKLNIQFIIVSHCTEIIEYADNPINI